MKNLSFVLVDKHSVAPSRATKESAGADLRADLHRGYELKTSKDSEFFRIPASFDHELKVFICIDPGTTVKINTGVKIAIPNGVVGLVFPRSGLSTKSNLMMVNSVGVIDSDYPGEISVTFKNVGLRPAMIFHGDRIAQLALVDCHVTALTQISEDEHASIHSAKGSERVGGHGSTGMA
jgi:dUTP pyrophosphatase